MMKKHKTNGPFPYDFLEILTASIPYRPAVVQRRINPGPTDNRKVSIGRPFAGSFVPGVGRRCMMVACGAWQSYQRLAIH